MFVSGWLCLLFGFWSVPNKTALKQALFTLPEVCRSCKGGILHFFEILKTPSRHSTSTQHPSRKLAHITQNVIGSVIGKLPVYQHFSTDHVDHQNICLAAETSPKLLYINRYDDDRQISLKNHNKKYKNNLTKEVQKRIIDNRKGLKHRGFQSNPQNEQNNKTGGFYDDTKYEID